MRSEIRMYICEKLLSFILYFAPRGIEALHLRNTILKYFSEHYESN